MEPKRRALTRGGTDSSAFDELSDAEVLDSSDESVVEVKSHCSCHSMSVWAIGRGSGALVQHFV